MTKLILCSLIFLVMFSVYLSTLCPTVFVGDAGELIAAAYNLGSPHPPGYPLFCILGKFTSIFIPSANIAYRVNLMCAILSSFALSILYLLIIKLLNNWIDSNNAVLNQTKNSLNMQLYVQILIFISVLFLGFSDTFWAQAVSAEVYALNIFLVIVLMFIIFAWSLGKKENKILYIFALIYGLGLGNHNISAFLCPVFAIFVLLINRNILQQRKVIFIIFFLFLLGGISIYLYLPLRALAKPLINWGDPETFRQFLDHVTRKQYGKLSKFAHSAPLFLQQMKFLYERLMSEFTLIPMLLAFIGALISYKNNKKVFLFLLLIFLFTTVLITLLINYQITPATLMASSVFFTPSYVIVCIWSSYCLVYLFVKIKNSKGIKIFYITVLLIAAIFLFKKSIFSNNLSDHFVAYDYGNCLLFTLPYESTVIASGDNSMFSLAYLQLVEKKRPDVEVYDDAGYIFPNIYGKGFMKLPALEQDKVRVSVQKEIITKAKGKVFYTLENTKHDMTGIELKSFGLLQEVILNKKPEEKNELLFWIGYKIHGINNPEMRERDYITRNLVAQYFYQFGNFYYEHKNAKLAKYNYDRANVIGYDNEWIQSNLGIILMNKNDVDSAIKLCEEAVKINPLSAEAHLNLGTAYDSKGLADKAIAEYKEAIKIKKEYAIAYFNLGNAYMGKGELKEAINEYVNALSYNPRSVESHINLGNALDNIGDIDNAIVEYKRALELNPSSFEAHINLGTSYFNKKLKEQAKDEYKKAILINPDSVEAHFNLGNLFFIDNNIEEAIKEYFWAIKINSAYSNAYTNLGLSYEKKGDIKKALEFWRKAVKLDIRQKKAEEKIKQYGN